MMNQALAARRASNIPSGLVTGNSPRPGVGSLSLTRHCHQSRNFRFGYGYPRDEQNHQRRRTRSSWQAYLDDLQGVSRRDASDTEPAKPTFHQVFNRRWFAFRTGCYAPGHGPDEFLRGVQQIHRHFGRPVPSSVRASSCVRQYPVDPDIEGSSEHRNDKGPRISKNKRRALNRTAKYTPSEHQSGPHTAGATTQTPVSEATPVKDSTPDQPPHRIRAYRIDPITNRKTPCYDIPPRVAEDETLDNTSQSRTADSISSEAVLEGQTDDKGEPAAPELRVDMGLNYLPPSEESAEPVASSRSARVAPKQDGPASELRVDMGLNHLPADEPSEHTNDLPASRMKQSPVELTGHLDSSGSVDTRQLHIDPQLFYDYTESRPTSSADALKFNDLDKYNTNLTDESPAKVEASAEYDDLAKYKTEVEDESPSEVGRTAPYDDLHQYEYKDTGDVHLASIGESAGKYDDLAAYRSDEFSGPRDEAPTDNTSAELNKDLSNYRTDSFPGPSIELASGQKPAEQYDDLADYKPASFPDPSEATTSGNRNDIEGLDEFDEKTKDTLDYEDARDRISAKLQHLDLGKAPDFDVSEETANKSNQPHESRDQLEKSMDDFAKAVVAGRKEGDRLSSGNPEPTSHSSPMTGNYFKDFPEDFSRSWTSELAEAGKQPPKKTDQWGFDVTPTGLETDFQSEIMENASRSRVDGSKDTNSGNTDPWGYDIAPKGLETDFQTEVNANSTRSQSLKDPGSRPGPASKTDEWGFDTTPTGLETDFESEAVGDPQIGQHPTNQGRRAVRQKDFVKAESSQHDANGSLQPALERSFQKRMCIQSIKGRGLRKSQFDEYSKDPQGLETSFAEECIDGSEPSSFSKTYSDSLLENGAKTNAKRDSGYPFDYGNVESFYERDPEVDGQLKTAERTTGDTDPTVYKILAYDPTMQTIDMAETTSVVPDQASPLSPTDVLLRLSHPTKFFPHFQPLREQGFEILSGGGDVLVFRKVRKAETPKKDQVPLVNPIDMMGSRATALPNAAAFASPTGFINYDVPEVDETPSKASTFKSNIDVRREEPVFSGPKGSAADGGKRKKRGVAGKMFLGGAWVAGVTYALGVVAEYFTTGGVDGQGPRSL